jgi:peptidoglycan/xylan/chitin deacetylase (PgdA/CDA1 family)
LPALEKISNLKWVQQLYPSCIWSIPGNDGKDIYLTFDDGPIPEVTPWVLDELRKHNARATFFCIGENVKKNPGLLQAIIKEGHSIGNHTNSHVNGWETLYRPYLEDIEKCDKVFKSNLFRPPYGKLKPLQLRAIREKYHIIMWSFLTGDYLSNLNCMERLTEIKQQAGPGSIIVFHDSLKAEKNLRILLPEVLNFYAQNGYTFKSIQLKNKI